MLNAHNKFMMNKKVRILIICAAILVLCFVWTASAKTWYVDDVSGAGYDTGTGTPPSIRGIHNGTIMPSNTITISKLYTYPGEGTGGHTEYVRIWNESWSVEATWNGYAGDWHNISFPGPFTLLDGHTYSYTIHTGSYLQIIHTCTLTNEYGTITCTEFTDTNGKMYNDWIPAIRLDDSAGGGGTVNDITSPSVTSPSANPPGVPNDGTTSSFLSVTVTDDIAVDIVTIDLSQIGGHAKYMLTYYGDALFGCNITPTCTPGTYNLTVNATDINGKYNNSVNVTVTVLPSICGAPEITSWYPAGTEIYDGEEATRTFNVTANQTVNVSWLINGTEVQKNTSVILASYTNISAAVGIWNVSTIVTNANGADMQAWMWIVTNVTPEAPEITAYAPGTPVYDIEAATRSFNVTVNQTVNVSWQINGTEVQLNKGVTEATYTNTIAAEGTWNVSAIVTNTNGTDMQVWVWIVTNVTPEAPEIAAYAPGTPVQDIEGATRTFNVTVNQTVHVSWQINGKEVLLNEGVTEAAYTNTSAAVGTWNVSAIVTNANGTDMQVWVWNVTKVTPEAPEITAYAPGTPVYDIEGATRTFNVTVNQTVHVSWQINGKEVQLNEGVTEAAYTNTSAAVGTWNVSAIVTNTNGTDMQAWVWNVTSKENQPPVANFTYSPANLVVAQAITFNASNSTDPDGNIMNYEWNFGDGGNTTNTTEQIIIHTYASAGTFTVNLTVTDDDGATNATSQAIAISEGLVFDTGTGTYPSIAGTHTGTITTNVTINVSKLYTYPCAGTGGHTEHVIIANNTGFILAEADWDGYHVDSHTITFDSSFTLVANETYSYTIRTGSYPQIIHADSKTVAGGTITCTSFVDTNGNEYEAWIPAIRLGE